MGQPSVRHLKTQITYREFAEWVAFYHVEPFGPIQEDFRAAVALMPTAGKGFKPERVFPSLAPPVRKQSPEHMKNLLRRLASRGWGTYKEGPNSGDDS